MLWLPSCPSLPLPRNYPRNRGTQVESEYSSLRRSLQRLAGAAHEILKRVATMKVGGPMGVACPRACLLLCMPWERASCCAC